MHTDGFIAKELTEDTAFGEGSRRACLYLAVLNNPKQVTQPERHFDVVRAHEDDFVCTRTSKACCFYRPVFEEISDIVIEKLSSHSFADIIGD